MANIQNVDITPTPRILRFYAAGVLYEEKECAYITKSQNDPL